MTGCHVAALRAHTVQKAFLRQGHDAESADGALSSASLAEPRGHPGLGQFDQKFYASVDLLKLHVPAEFPQIALEPARLCSYPGGVF